MFLPRSPEDMVRRQVAQEAARLLYHHEVRDYQDAKRKAVRALGLSERGSHRWMPRNAEVRYFLEAQVHLHEGEGRFSRLSQLRRRALALMKILAPFQPLLTGSVCRGNVRAESDINLWCYSDSADAVEKTLRAARLRYSVHETQAARGSRRVLVIEEAPPVRIEVRPLAQRARRRRSPITGQAQPFLDLAALGNMVDEDPTLWEDDPDAVPELWDASSDDQAPPS